MPRHKRQCVPRNSESTLHSKQLLMMLLVWVQLSELRLQMLWEGDVGGETSAATVGEDQNPAAVVSPGHGTPGAGAE